MNGENLQVELEPGVIVLGAAYLGGLLMLIAWLAA